MSTSRTPAAFTLIELIIVMALLAVVAALAVPSLSGTTRQRTLNDEAGRFLALTEYCREEAISQGVPMTLWLDPSGKRFGVEPKTGFGGAGNRDREYNTHPDVTFQADKIKKSGGIMVAVECAPDGSLSTSSVESVQLVDRFNSTVSVTRTLDGWGYEIVKEENVRRRAR